MRNNRRASWQKRGTPLPDACQRCIDPKGMPGGISEKAGWSPASQGISLVAEARSADGRKERTISLHFVDFLCLDKHSSTRISSGRRDGEIAGVKIQYVINRY